MGRQSGQGQHRGGLGDDRGSGVLPYPPVSFLRKFPLKNIAPGAQAGVTLDALQIGDAGPLRGYAGIKVEEKS